MNAILISEEFAAAPEDMYEIPRLSTGKINTGSKNRIIHVLSLNITFNSFFTIVNVMLFNTFNPPIYFLTC